MSLQQSSRCEVCCVISWKYETQSHGTFSCHWCSWRFRIHLPRSRPPIMPTLSVPCGSGNGVCHTWHFCLPGPVVNDRYVASRRLQGSMRTGGSRSELLEASQARQMAYLECFTGWQRFSSKSFAPTSSVGLRHQGVETHFGGVDLAGLWEEKRCKRWTFSSRGADSNH